MSKLVIGIDARIALLHARGWARFALDFTEAISEETDLLKKLNPDDTIWKHYPEDDVVRWVGGKGA